jgi:hypothetical protein
VPGRIAGRAHRPAADRTGGGAHRSRRRTAVKAGRPPVTTPGRVRPTGWWAASRAATLSAYRRAGWRWGSPAGRQCLGRQR